MFDKRICYITYFDKCLNVHLFIILQVYLQHLCLKSNTITPDKTYNEI